MKKTISTVMLITIITLGFAGSIGAKDSAFANPKVHAACIDSEGKWIDSKECGTATAPACGCLFHQIIDYISDLVS